MRHLLLLLTACGLSTGAMAQLTGTKTIDPAGTGSNNYATFTAAVQALNAGGVGTGGVTFQVKAGATFTEAVPAITVSGSSANPIRFTKSGAGANPVLQTVGTGATDAVLTLDGADYVRLDSLALRENPANTTAAQMTEYGLWLKGGATNNTVQGCSIELSRNNANKSYGVHVLDGGNNSNRFYNDAVSNCTSAYYFAGTTATYDTDNEIGTLTGGRSQVSQIGVPASGGPPVTTIVYAVYLKSQTRVKVFGLELTDVQGPGSVYGLYSTGTNNSADLTDNVLRNVQSNATGTGIVEAIYIDGGTTSNIFRNRLDGVRAGGSTAFAVGIDVTGGTTNNVVNNFVLNVAAPASTAGTAVRALSLRGGTTNNVFHNTVLVEYAATVASNKSGAFFMSGASTPGYVVNNIFVNRVTGLTPGAGGIGAAFFKATNTLTTLSAGSGNNLYYAGTPSAEHPIFYGASTTAPALATTLTDFKQLAAPAEQASVTENPPFVSSTDLHISTTTPTQVESGGQSLVGGTGVSTDIDGDARNVTTPDLGADEGTFQRVDLAGPAIVLTALGNTSSLTSRTLSGVAITDASGVNVAAGSKPRLYYKKTTDANVFTAANDATGNGWKWTEASNAASPFSFTLDVAKLRSAPVAGDSVQYFVVAQDLAATPNVAASPGVGFVGTSVAAISSAPTRPYVYRVLGFISGVKTVGTSAAADYPTLTAAVADLNRSELNGALTLRLIDANYANEVFPITINANPGTRPTPTTSPRAVLIQPATGTGSVVMRGTATTPLLIVNASYVGIDGGTAQNRRLRLRNDGTGSASGVIFASGRNVAISNAELIAGSSTTGYGVAFDGVTAGRLANCLVQRANVGVQLQNNCDSVQVFGNTIGATVAADKIGTTGVVVLSSQHFDVRGNTVAGVTRAASPAVTGVQVSGTSREGLVRGNLISDITHTGTTTATSYGAVGIRLASTDAASAIRVDNNMVRDVLSYGDDGFTYAPHGILASGGGGYAIVYNTVALSGAMGGGATPQSAALLLNTGVTGVAAVNNILVNNITSTPAGGRSYALLVAGTAASTLLTSNSNDYYVTGTQAALGSVNGVDATTVTGLRAATGQDARSVSAGVGFVSATDLHLNQLNCGIAGVGTALPNVPTDIDGDVRSTTVPVIGADEANICVTAVAQAKASWQTSVYPNPSSGLLTVAVKGAQGPLTLEVLDALGRPVRQQALPAGADVNQTVDLRGQAAGVYLLRLSNGRESSSQRVVLR
ncbi:T9SS type A sorting domain-containing protein [Hymenobacter sp. 15J16-1T3B]|uniref:T9SS type A sorting domain-containing protein n=1 Tax=Hymenobacter sp. 15J16-1T3B TaxID=2886941 RepID=UPI001D0F6A9E|nr:T9SS type A sorting domain-containing protein [Hymenobacter sp. 15J16-1T3B]MCC3156251.1 T9SS type A sorting domain-containing protein [Hymenobacter sp. 15J16-1T3B]